MRKASRSRRATETSEKIETMHAKAFPVPTCGLRVDGFHLQPCGRLRNGRAGHTRLQELDLPLWADSERWQSSRNDHCVALCKCNGIAALHLDDAAALDDDHDLYR